MLGNEQGRLENEPQLPLDQRRSGPLATRDDVERVVGDVDETTILEILALQPTLAEFEEAAVWSRGEGDTIGKAGHTLSGVSAQVFDILTADDEEE